MKPKTSDYSSVQKAIEILMAFLPDGQEMGTLEVSRKLEMHKSTVSRLIGLLSYHNLLSHNNETKKYTLGRVIADLGKAANQSFSNRLHIIAQPIMDQLRDKVGESVGLEAVLQNDIVVVAEAPGLSMVRVAFDVNQKVAMHVAAGAKAILAFSTPEFVDSCIKGELEAYTPNTITDLKIFKKQLKEIAKQGVAFDRGEINRDVHAIGTPIFNPAQKPIAAIVICMIESKMNTLLENGLADDLKTAAAQITEQIRLSEDD